MRHRESGSAIDRLAWLALGLILGYLAHKNYGEKPHESRETVARFATER